MVVLIPSRLLTFHSLTLDPNTTTNGCIITTMKIMILVLSVVVLQQEQVDALEMYKLWGEVDCASLAPLDTVLAIFLFQVIHFKCLRQQLLFE